MYFYEYGIYIYIYIANYIFWMNREKSSAMSYSGVLTKFRASEHRIFLSKRFSQCRSDADLPQQQDFTNLASFVYIHVSECVLY